MNERCMCGDPECPSCGPAQGFGTAFDPANYDQLDDGLLKEVLVQFRARMKVRSGFDIEDAVKGLNADWEILDGNYLE